MIRRRASWFGHILLSMLSLSLLLSSSLSSIRNVQRCGRHWHFCVVHLDPLPPNIVHPNCLLTSLIGANDGVVFLFPLPLLSLSFSFTYLLLTYILLYIRKVSNQDNEAQLCEVEILRSLNPMSFKNSPRESYGGRRLRQR